MVDRQELKLTWIAKKNRPRLEPRILPKDPSMNCHARRRVTTTDSFDNRLVFGDKLLALKAEVIVPLTSFENGMFKYFAVHQRVAAT